MRLDSDKVSADMYVYVEQIFNSNFIESLLLMSHLVMKVFGCVLADCYSQYYLCPRIFTF